MWIKNKKKNFDDWKCDWQPSIRYYLGFRQVYFQLNDLLGITRRNKKSREKTVAVGWTDGRTDGRPLLEMNCCSMQWGKVEADIKFAHDRSSPRNQEHEMDEDLDLEHFLWFNGYVCDTMLWRSCMVWNWKIFQQISFFFIKPLNNPI